VILATDGDFNVGVSNENELENLITSEREKGIYLTCLGFGMGNYKDSKMELLADRGNGNYDYIDDVMEANKTLVHEFGGTLFTVAKDVKAQVEFNPSAVQSYRLVGYENRVLNEEDFKDDKKDAGDMGSGHTVTIIYEVIPTGVNSEATRSVDPLKYQHSDETGNAAEIATVKFRYKQPEEDKSKEMIHSVPNELHQLQEATNNAQFATSVAMFGMLLKKSKYINNCNYNHVLHLATLGKGDDRNGYRKEFIELVKTVNDIKDAIGYNNQEN
jgi:Ca-activated chloride channel family protein